jgi:solute carrier family 25 (mitochondrial dicarboxylate transporter), member 10
MSSVRPSAQVRETSRDVRPAQKGKIHYPFWFGGSASCFAACVTHPLDLGEFFTLIYQELC